jgi:hypothetical protein
MIVPAVTVTKMTLNYKHLLKPTSPIGIEILPYDCIFISLHWTRKGHKLIVEKKINIMIFLNHIIGMIVVGRNASRSDIFIQPFVVSSSMSK